MRGVGEIRSFSDLNRLVRERPASCPFPLASVNAKRRSGISCRGASAPKHFLAGVFASSSGVGVFGVDPIFNFLFEFFEFTVHLLYFSVALRLALGQIILSRIRRQRLDLIVKLLFGRPGSAADRRLATILDRGMRRRFNANCRDRASPSGARTFARVDFLQRQATTRSTSSLMQCRPTNRATIAGARAKRLAGH